MLTLKLQFTDHRGPKFKNNTTIIYELGQQWHVYLDDASNYVHFGRFDSLPGSLTADAVLHTKAYQAQSLQRAPQSL